MSNKIEHYYSDPGKGFNQFHYCVEGYERGRRFEQHYATVYLRDKKSFLELLKYWSATYKHENVPFTYSFFVVEHEDYMEMMESDCEDYLASSPSPNRALCAEKSPTQVRVVVDNSVEEMNLWLEKENSTVN